MEWNPFHLLTAFGKKQDRILYSIDSANNRTVTGWCFDLKRPEKAVHLRFFLDDREIGGTEAVHFREDVRSYNLHPTGRCGFTFLMPPEPPIRNHRFLKICAAPSSKPFHLIPTRQLPIVLEGLLPKLFFMHIPKTAGTSFNAFCRLHFPDDRVAVHLESVPPSEYPALLKEKNYLSGHLTLMHMKDRMDVSEFDLLSLVREPFRHLHSHLGWVRSIASDPESGFFAKHHPAVQETALKLRGIDFSNQKQLEVLAETISGIEVDFFDNLQTRYFLDYRPERVTRQDLDRAIRNLDRFRLIGITEQYDHFIDRVCREYGMERILPPVFNKAQVDRLFFHEAVEVRRALRPLVECDLFLYDWIQQSMHRKK
ncbi:MAG: hypothetical protein JRI83_07510 [Deltaproteobacteria bacterium]|nr:hypothetical protein [Deltaproteobacteria bacterium]MBW2133360.1 hypothetical protein [Deltaproteobacteria bacterium]